MEANSASVETVLNSRCSSGFDNNHRQNHWGLFLRDHHPAQESINEVLRCCKGHGYLAEKLLVWREDQYIYLGFRKTNDPFDTRLLHINSGIQQEAVYLSCTALGLGTCIHNLGIDGTTQKDKIATAKHLILEKTDSYETGKFTASIPGPEKTFIKGKILTEPRRNSNVECLSELKQISFSQNSGSQANENHISQLLWAAKGRTPHYIKSHPWGLTIPTWGGGQNYTSVYLITDNRLFQYTNWTMPLLPFWWKMGRPTHDLKFIRKTKLSSQLDGTNTGIILSRNEKTNRSLWEVGYMLENMLLQSRSIGISFKSIIFKLQEITELERSGISEPVAALIL